MFPLTQTIKDRIKTAKQIPQIIINIIDTHSIVNSVDASSKINRAILKLLSQIKKKQKERVNAQGQQLEDIKGLRFLNTKTIEQVYSNTLEIFSFYDQSFKSSDEPDRALQDSLKNLYLSFFYKYQSKISAKYIFKMIQHHITQSTPFILMGWVSEWSRTYFNEQLQSAIQNQMIRHQQYVRQHNNTRNSSIAVIRDKLESPIHYANVGRNEQPVQQKLFTNKQSVYGLFLDELIQYYRLLPLDLDFQFLKAMRKLHSKNNKLQIEEHLRKAAEVLIECKNKNIRQQIKQYHNQYQSFIDIHPQSKPVQNYKKKPNQSFSPQHKIVRNNFKRPTLQQRFFDRVKTQAKQSDSSTNQQQKRKSLLLYPKTNKICFQSSQEIMRKIHYEKQKKVFELPLINHSNRILSDHIRSSIIKNSALSPINNSIISNYQRGIIKHFVLANKKTQTKTTPVAKYTNPISSSQQAVRQIVEHVHLKKLKGDKRKRKLMLQILREKNKNVFLDQ